MPHRSLYLGVDIGTSGARAIIIDDEAVAIADGQCPMAEIGSDHRDPYVWLGAAKRAMHMAFAQIDPNSICAISVDGTSGTMLPINHQGKPLAEGCMYNDPCNDADILESIARSAPQTSAAHGATSGLARAISFCARFDADKVVHQADWIAGQMAGVYSSDENNALKTGYDPVLGKWPDWIEKTGLDISKLPNVIEPGRVVSSVNEEFAAEFGLSLATKIVAGTTDGCASFLATGAEEVGDGVTALGTTITIKLLCDQPIFSPQSGIYSHRILGKWLSGGASNSGGNVLLAYFQKEQISQLSNQIDAETDSPLNYYPLVNPGERFPIADPELAPRLSPRPNDDIEFLKGLLQGMTEVEALGYSRLAEFGGPALRSVRTVGGGAGNPVWTRMRERKLQVPFLQPASNDAAYGAALLAHKGATD